MPLLLLLVPADAAWRTAASREKGVSGPESQGAMTRGSLQQWVSVLGATWPPAVCLCVRGGGGGWWWLSLRCHTQGLGACFSVVSTAHSSQLCSFPGWGKGVSDQLVKERTFHLFSYYHQLTGVQYSYLTIIIIFISPFPLFLSKKIFLLLNFYFSVQYEFDKDVYYTIVKMHTCAYKMNFDIWPQNLHYSF